MLLDDGWLRTGDLVERQRRRHVHVRRPAEGGDPPAGREPRRRRRSRRRWPRHPDVLEAAVIGVPSELSEEEIKAFVAVARPGRRRPRRVREHAAGRLTPLQGAALPRGRRPSSRTPRPAASPSTSCRASAADARGRLRGDAVMTERLAAHGDRGVDAGRDHRRGPRPGRRADGPAHASPSSRSCWCSGRDPTRRETRILDAVLVSLADHGLTPTRAGRPADLHGRARGAAGRGRRRACSARAACSWAWSRTPRVFLAEHPGRRGGDAATTARARGAADAVARRRTPAARPGPRPPGAQGRGPAHAAPVRDRRARTGSARPAPAAAAAGGRVHEPSRAAATLPINGAGVARRRARRPRLHPAIVRGFALIARTAGLVGHLAEEMAAAARHAPVRRGRPAGEGRTWLVPDLERGAVRDGDPVPGVDGGDRQHQRRELLVLEAARPPPPRRRPARRARRSG